MRGDAISRFETINFPIFFKKRSGYHLFSCGRSEDFGYCPYCDPNFSGVPGLAQALTGYDLAMGNPNPGRNKNQ